MQQAKIVVEETIPKSKTIIIRKPYDKHERLTFTCKGETMTQQNFQDECDINKIMEQYKRTGIIEHIKDQIGSYVDLPNETDYQGALNIVIGAKETFEELPGTLRAKFQNDPIQFLNYMDSPKNLDEKRELGLVEPAKAAALPETRQVDDAEGEKPPAETKKD